MTVSEAVITADSDDKCQLLSATCDENGFEITFDSLCQAQDYKAVKWNELYAARTTLNTVPATFDTAAPVNSECVFHDNDNNGVYEMKFSFKQCSTSHDTDNADNLIYFNSIQAQEYYDQILFGVKVECGLTCTADRIATITTATHG